MKTLQALPVGFARAVWSTRSVDNPVTRLAQIAKPVLLVPSPNF
jgi:hypothetical protein